ncbi:MULTISPECIES: outer membrane protein OmpV [unclassified Shewanella]|uniref:outer membrane protein OmpV n=1 Tax=unclassified Shewanella TaxID=196818 RepID=UPI001BC1DE5C|nr:MULTISPECIES: MipA/OmpV family protein [unclassified Shewanella]GIU05242.1 outer membrane protein OmpV [Shewanella sp. MBTL60-112-B1]GIU24226.1 outer membrane protein OmpV [Shewanella sp. MBTL60-112-B2]
MKKTCLVISTLLLTNSVFAADNTYIRNGNIYSHEGQFFAGAGAATGSEFYKGQDHKTGVYINGGYHGEDFNADLSGINYRFFGNNDSAINFSAFVVTNPGFDSNDADVLTGMKDRKISGDLGLNADIKLGRGTLSSKFQHDVTGVYDGYQADVTYYQPMNIGFADFVPYAGVHYYSKDFVNYYAGVSKSDATSDRAAYKGDGAFAYKAGYALVIPLTEHLDITQATGYSRLSSDMADSPLVGSNNQWVTTLGVSYSF